MARTYIGEIEQDIVEADRVSYMASPPLKALRFTTQRTPKLFQAIDLHREAHKDEWPASCFIPGRRAQKLMNDDTFIKRSLRRFPELAQSDDAIKIWCDTNYHAVRALAPWRTTKGIYSIHPDVLQALRDTPVETSLPVAQLEHLPEWCLYLPLDLKVNNGSGAGAFVFLDYRDDLQHALDDLKEDPEYDLDDEEEVIVRQTLGEWALDLRILMIDHEGVPIFSLLVPLHPIKADEVFFEYIIDFVMKTTVHNEVTDGFNANTIMPLSEVARQAEELRWDIYLIISTLLYIVSITSEEPADNEVRPEFPVPKMTKRGPRLFPPDRPKVWAVSYRLGAQISMAKTRPSDGAGGAMGIRMRPHIRRAHWHRFWTGSKSNQDARRLVAHWLPPIVVAASDTEDVVPTVRPVAVHQNLLQNPG